MTSALKAVVQARAAELGFDLCRIAPARPVPEVERYTAWLAAGYHGEMAYLARQAPRRADLQQVLPGVRSVICLAASYHDPVATAEAAPGRGVVARYARYADYHQVLGRKLQELADHVNRLGGPDTRSRWYVDTGPVTERALAQRAGLGFVGKHTNLIHRTLGNWFFLAEILTTLELEPDSPERNRCGTCTRCLAACPTGAIRAPFVLDARRCLSYLTIELKGPIPVELRPALGARIFGCDDCLEVCPWNRFARAGRLMRAHVRPELAAPNLLEWLALDEAGFRARFADTPLRRVRRRGLLRNVCVALGNTGGGECLPALRRTAADPDPLIAEHAQWAVDQIERRCRTPDRGDPDAAE